MGNVLVVGAAGGIGLEVARLLAGQGDKVIGTVMDQAQADQLRNAIPSIAQVEILDLADAAKVASRVTEIVGALDGLDRIAVCAAVGPLGPTELSPLADYQQALNVNFLSHVAIYQASIDALRASKGKLLFISSMSGKVALPFVGAYTASKHALEGWADIVRQEVAADGVDVILIEPGGVRTGMVSAQIAWAKDALAKLTPAQAERYGPLFQGFIAAAQAGYDGAGSTPQQVAEVIVDALSSDAPETRYVVGPDAQQLIGARAALSDREMDATMAAFFGGGAG